MSDGESQKLTELKNTMAASFNQTISTVECRQKSTCVYIILHLLYDATLERRKTHYHLCVPLNK